MTLKISTATGTV